MFTRGLGWGSLETNPKMVRIHELHHWDRGAGRGWGDRERELSWGRASGSSELQLEPWN